VVAFAHFLGSLQVLHGDTTTAVAHKFSQRLFNVFGTLNTIPPHPHGVFPLTVGTNMVADISLE
jgi:hypothetical protein